MPLINGDFVALEMPEKHARVLFDNSKRWRYRALYGGRGAGKDWAAKAALIEMAVRRPIRVLFARELQNSIKDSSHQLIKDTILRLGYSEYFTVLDNEIRGKNGSLFIYKGIRSNTEEIKSLEGIDYCVLDEAQPLTEESWIIIDPTIRKAGSEIWFLFNVLLESDLVYQFCVKNPPDNLIGEMVNYTDNPYCPQELIDQANRMKVDNYQLYENVWLGRPRSLGLFFTEFGAHNRCHPFVIGDQDDNSRIFGSLDHGIAHYTSFGLWYLDPDGSIYRVLTYCANGGTTRGHAEAICEVVSSCRFTRYMFPCEIYYDYAMDTKHRLNEFYYRSDIDEYKDVFSAQHGGKDTIFIPANKRKVDGCHAMKQCFVSPGNGGPPIVRYYDGLNDPFVLGVKSVISDNIEPEMYAKMDGDDCVDEARYGIMGMISKTAAAKTTATKSAPIRINAVRPLDMARQYGGLV